MRIFRLFTPVALRAWSAVGTMVAMGCGDYGAHPPVMEECTENCSPVLPMGPNGGGGSGTGATAAPNAGAGGGAGANDAGGAGAPAEAPGLNAGGAGGAANTGGNAGGAGGAANGSGTATFPDAGFGVGGVPQ